MSIRKTGYVQRSADVGIRELERKRLERLVVSGGLGKCFETFEQEERRVGEEGGARRSS